MRRSRGTLTRTALTAVHTVLLAAAIVRSAAAQDPGPIGPYVVDVRGSFVNVGQVVELAAARGLGPAQLRKWGLGLDVGGHLYLFEWRGITFGVGGSALFTAPSRTPGDDDPDAGGPAVKTRFTALSPQLSFNFGDGDGWSYLSGGLGTSRMTVYVDQPTVPEQRRARTLNYGGGGALVRATRPGALARPASLCDQPAVTDPHRTGIAAHDPDGVQHRGVVQMTRGPDFSHR